MWPLPPSLLIFHHFLTFIIFFIPIYSMLSAKIYFWTKFLVTFRIFLRTPSMNYILLSSLNLLEIQYICKTATVSYLFHIPSLPFFYALNNLVAYHTLIHLISHYSLCNYYLELYSHPCNCGCLSSTNSMSSLQVDTTLCINITHLHIFYLNPSVPMLHFHESFGMFL